MKAKTQRKVPMRKCVVSQQMFPKKELVRIVKNKEGEIFIDPTGRQNGRGAYIALDPELAKTAKQRHVFEQVFETKISDDFYDELYRYLEHQKARKELL